MGGGLRIMGLQQSAARIHCGVTRFQGALCKVARRGRLAGLSILDTVGPFSELNPKSTQLYSPRP